MSQTQMNNVNGGGCNWCKNKNLRDYQNHTSRNCPDLAQEECAWCHNFGHIKSKCLILQRKNELEAAIPLTRNPNSWANKLITGKCDQKVLDNIKKTEDEQLEIERQEKLKQTDSIKKHKENQAAFKKRVVARKNAIAAEEFKNKVLLIPLEFKENEYDGWACYETNLFKAYLNSDKNK